MKNSPFSVAFHPAGGNALVAEFGKNIDPSINDAVLELDRLIREEAIPGVGETVPTYRSLLVEYDPRQVRYGDLCERIASLEVQSSGVPSRNRRWTLPVAYGGIYGPDLEDTASAAGLSPDEFAAAHADVEYRVYMLGFAPGFAYLGDLPERLQASRLAEPRQRTPAGGVSVGGAQTAISSVSMPSAWRFIGQTPVRMFDPRREDPFLLRPGDRVMLSPIRDTEFENLSRAVDDGETGADWTWVA